MLTRREFISHSFMAGLLAVIGKLPGHNEVALPEIPKLVEAKPVEPVDPWRNGEVVRRLNAIEYTSPKQPSLEYMEESDTKGFTLIVVLTLRRLFSAECGLSGAMITNVQLAALIRRIMSKPSWIEAMHTYKNGEWQKSLARRIYTTPHFYSEIVNPTRPIDAKI